MLAMSRDGSQLPHPEIPCKAVGMPSWRDTTSESAQDDLDNLLRIVMPLAEQTLASHGEMYPFGARISNDGEVGILGAETGLGDNPPSQQVLVGLYAGAHQESESLRAVAFVADVNANGGDAVRVELEHREGTALTVLVPYTRSRFTKKLTTGQMSVSLGQSRVFTA